jgi:RHS repeat-associated protein
MRVRVALLSLAAAIACGENGSIPVGEVYTPPAPGRMPGATFVSTPAGKVNVGNGNLLVRRVDLEISTRLGPIHAGETFNSADAEWVDLLNLRYDGVTLIDDPGSRLSGRALEDSGWSRVDDDTVRTRGGRLYRFDGGLLTRIEAPFPDGPLLVLERDARGRLVQIVQRRERWPDETLLEVRYEGNVALYESYGRTAECVRDSDDRVRSVRDPAAFERAGPQTVYDYDERGRLSRIVDPKGVVTLVRYDRWGRAIEVRRGSERHEFRYELRASRSARFATLHTDPTGALTEYRHSGSGEVTWRRDPLGAVWRAGYHRGLPIWSEDPLGARWSFEYDGGDLIGRTDPLGAREAREPFPGGWSPADPDRTPWHRRTDVRGAVWTQEFDAYGRPVVHTDPTGARHGLEHRGAGVHRIEKPTGFEVCLHYDAPHGQVTAIDPGCRASPGVVLRSQAGQRIDDVGGGLRVFDASGRLREIFYPSASSFDPTRFLFERDVTGRVIGGSSPYGARLQIDRDAGGRVVAVRELVELDPNTGTEEWTGEEIGRDRAGRLISRTRPNGNRVEIQRDVGGRVVGVRYLGAAGDLQAEVRLQRDPVGRIVRIDDSREAGPTSIERDLLGRARLIRYPHGEWVVQSFDPGGLLTRLELYLSDGALLRDFEWVRDRLGRPVQLLESADLVAEVTYAPGEREVRFANGVTHQRIFDGMDRLRRLVLRAPDRTPVRELDLTYWTVGVRPTPHLMQVVERTEGDGGLSIAYDEGGRLSYWFGSSTYRLQWDVVGNLTLSDEHGPDRLRDRFGLRFNHLRTRIGSVGLDGVIQDVRGRVVRIGDRTIEWEPFDRPRRLGEVELRYSTLGTPISRTVGGVETTFLFGGLVQADAQLRPRALELGSLYVDLGSGEREYLHRDFRNNVAWVTDDRGALVAVRRFGPFGTRELEGHARSRRGFAGGEEIGEFVLLGARVYFPRGARFLSPDPIPNWINRYTYSHGDPVNFWDPTGLERRETKTAVELEIAGRPLPYARFRILVDEVVIDDPDPETTEEDEGRPEPEPTGSPSPAPAQFPETPNTPTIPDITLPPRFGGCDAISRSPAGVARVLVLLPFLLLLAPRVR